jgi:hypothetical protein
LSWRNVSDDCPWFPACSNGLLDVGGYEGAHRTYMTDFIRDPRTGGCAAGPNLGFRLVVDTGFPELRDIVLDVFNSVRMG